MEKANNDNLVKQIEGSSVKEATKKGPRALLDLSYTKNQLAAALGNSMGVDRFVRVCATLLNSNSKLRQGAEQNPTSFVASCIEIAQAGLDPSIPNEVALIPWGGKTNAVRPMYGYKGLLKLCMRAGENLGNPYKKLLHEVVYENDLFEYSLGDEPSIVHKPPKLGKERGAAIGYYALAEDTAGRRNLLVMSKQDAEKHKARYVKDQSKITDFDRWAAKTVLRLLISRSLPMDGTLSKAVLRDTEQETGEEQPALDADFENVPEEINE